MASNPHHYQILVDPIFLPPVYIIGMDGDAMRRRNVENICQRRDVSIKKFSAIEPNDLDQIAAYDAAYRQHKFGCALTKGEVGCFLSHQMLWKECVRINQPICILEDDVELPSDFAQILCNALACQADWDVLRLLAERWDRKGIAIGRFDEVRQLSHYPRPAMGTAAYLLTPKAAGTLLAGTELIRVPVDQVIDQYWRHHLRVLVVEPYPVHIRSDCPSVIAKRGWEISHGRRRRPLMRRLQRDLRNIADTLLGLWHSLPYLWIALRYRCDI